MAHDPRVRVGAAAILVNSDDEVLLLRRGKEATHGAGDWGLPGGWVDYGEQPHESATRELSEEAGLNSVVDPEFSGYTHDVHPEGFSVVCLFFEFQLDHIDGWPEENKEPDKHDGIGWFKISDLKRGALEDNNLFAPLQSALLSLDIFRVRGRKK